MDKKKKCLNNSSNTIIAGFIITFLSVQISFGQETGFIGGVGSAYTFNDDLLGVNGRLYYGTNEKFCFGPEASFFPYQEVDEDYEIQLLDISINAHYIFELFEKFGVYPLTGINYTSEWERLIENNQESEIVEEFGINYGFGLHYSISKFYVFTEFSGVIGQLNDEFITAGVIFNLGSSKSEESKE